MDSAIASRLERIRVEVERLRRSGARKRVFGAGDHRFRFARPLAPAQIEAFEREHGIMLPEELRAFVSTLGNGGAGPDYGLLPIERFADQTDPIPPGFLAADFPYSADADLPPMEEFTDEEYRWQTCGSMRVCDQGCGYYVLLVVSGPERGSLWIDARVSDGGICRFTHGDGTPMGLLDWYEWWLNEVTEDADFPPDELAPIAPAMSAASTLPQTLPADWRDFLALTKPRVMSLVVFTGLCGMLAARTPIHPVLGFTAILCIALGAGAAGALNQWYEADIDSVMKRTAKRPLPAGRMERRSALHFGVGLSCFSVILMGLALNLVAAGILAVSILFYVFVYTVWLKRRTPQNIVIGGAAGAFPPLIGWAAATGNVAALPLLLFALIFLWTPPHFWALALFVKTDYAEAGVPMLPVVAGERSTRIQIGLYTLPMAAAAVAPWPLGLTGPIYGAVAVAGTAIFAALAAQVATRTSAENDAMVPEKRLFKYSILYLFILFAAVALDRGLA